MGKRTVVITGGAKGIGYAAAQAFVSKGYNVAILDNNLALAQQAASQLDPSGTAVISCVCDVSNVESIRDAIKAVAEQFAGIDVVVTSAGILTSTPIKEITPEEWNRVLSIDLGGVFFTIQQALPYLEKSSAPRVINISSLAGRMGGYETGLAYSAAKGGVLSLTMGMARQLAPQGITVNCVCPSTTESDMSRQFTPEARERLIARVPLGRFALPEEVASAVAYLASEEAGYITGLLMDVNGGTYMG